MRQKKAMDTHTTMVVYAMAVYAMVVFAMAVYAMAVCSINLRIFRMKQ